MSRGRDLACAERGADAAVRFVAVETVAEAAALLEGALEPREVSRKLGGSERARGFQDLSFAPDPFRGPRP